MKKLIVAAAVCVTFHWSSLAAAAQPQVSAAEQKVLDAIAGSAPGDTITVPAGFYQGGWKLKPGLPGKPITLRAEGAGRVFIGLLETHIGFIAVPGAEYSFSKPISAAPPKLRELDTGKDMRWMATITDVEEVVGSYCFDEESKRLYIHPTDSAAVSHHTYASIPTTYGITVADHTVVDGFVMTGFGAAAIYAPGVKDATVQNCKLYRNGSGISLGGAKQCVIRNNECWENSPDYSQSAQIYMQDYTEGTLIEGNLVRRGLGGHAGIFIYGENRNNTLRHNIVWGAPGLGIKGRDNSGDIGEFNVTDSWVGTYGMGWNTGARSDSALGRPDASSDLLVDDLKADPKFADPAWADCRLQSDSPARGKARDGKDLGAYQYAGDVLFVKPDGNDGAAGTSIASAWKTLAHASQALQPGQTLYILPGNYAEPLVLHNKPAAAQKTLVRVHGKGVATVQRVEIDDCASLELAYVSVRSNSELASALPMLARSRCSIAPAISIRLKESPSQTATMFPSSIPRSGRTVPGWLSRRVATSSSFRRSLVRTSKHNFNLPTEWRDTSASSTPILVRRLAARLQRKSKSTTSTPGENCAAANRTRMCPASTPPRLSKATSVFPAARSWRPVASTIRSSARRGSLLHKSANESESSGLKWSLSHARVRICCGTRQGEWQARHCNGGQRRAMATFTIARATTAASSNWSTL